MVAWEQKSQFRRKTSEAKRLYMKLNCTSIMSQSSTQVSSSNFTLGKFKEMEEHFEKNIMIFFSRKVKLFFVKITESSA